MRFSEQWVEPITEGRKVQTIRRTARVAPGDQVTAMVKGRAFARLEIEAVDVVPVAELDAHDARREDVPDVETLRQAVHRLYRGADVVARVRFRLVETLGGLA